MADVWKATDLQLARPVAVKLLKPHLAAESTLAERFRREAIAAANLNHDNIVTPVAGTDSFPLVAKGKPATLVVAIDTQAPVETQPTPTLPPADTSLHGPSSPNTPTLRRPQSNVRVASFDELRKS